MSDSQFVITFPASSTAEANRHAAGLSNSLKDLDRSVIVSQQRDRQDTQDFGATVVLILGTASVTSLARGIAGWLKRTGTVIEISRGGTVLAKNIDSADMARIVEALSRQE
jgi:hypothetical protein